jgi:hypothetical protein
VALASLKVLKKSVVDKKTNNVKGELVNFEKELG